MALDLNDKTSNGNTLTNNNGATEVTSSLPFAQSTKAVDFAKASSQYLSAADSASLSLTGDFTFEFWIKFTSLPADASAYALITKFGTSPNQGFACDFLHDTAQTNDYNIRLFLTPDGSTLSQWVVGFPSDPSTGVWYHYGIVFTAASHKLEVFLDGSSVGSDTAASATSIYDNTKDLLIGAYDSGSIGNYADYKMDDVRIWSATRSGAQITANKDIELTGSESGLVAYWPFESTLGSNTGGSFLLNFV